MRLAVKTYSDLFKNMDTVISRAMETMGKMCKEIITMYIKDYYYDYEPDWYNRTFQFLDSCVSSHLYKSGNLYYIDIFIDYENLHYKLRNPKLVVEWANEGLHGGYDLGSGDSHFWDESMERLVPDNMLLVENFVSAFQKYTGCKVEKR